MPIHRDTNEKSRGDAGRPRRSWRRRMLLALMSVFVFAFAVAGVLWVAPLVGGTAHAGDGTAAQTGGQKVVIFEDIIIGPEQAWNNVVAVGGDVIVEGVVAESVVAVAGDVTIRANARVGYDRPGHDDAAIVSVFGDVIVESGADVSGRVVDVGGGAGKALTAAFVDPVARPWKWTSVVGWIVSTIFLVIATVIVAAIAPRKIAAVRDRARHHFLSSLGWGVIGAVIGIPVITILLIVTVVGLLVVIPWLAIVVPIILLFGFVAVAALLGRLILGQKEDLRSQVIAAAVVGVVILCVVRWIPYAGAIILAIVTLVGLGAIITAIWGGRRGSREKAPVAPAPQPPAPQPPGGWQQVPPPANEPPALQQTEPRMPVTWTEVPAAPPVDAAASEVSPSTEVASRPEDSDGDEPPAG